MNSFDRILSMDNLSTRTAIALIRILDLPGVSSDNPTAEAIAAALIELDEGLTQDLY
jgi:hypothetical protein